VLIGNEMTQNLMQLISSQLGKISVIGNQFVSFSIIPINTLE